MTDFKKVVKPINEKTVKFVKKLRKPLYLVNQKNVYGWLHIIIKKNTALSKYNISFEDNCENLHNKCLVIL